MGKLIGALRVKDEEIYIEKTIDEACKYCDELAIIDDWSKDKTIEIINEVCYLNKIPYRIIKSPDEKYHEGRDRDLLLNLVHEMKGEWCIQIDADEVYEQDFVKELKFYMNSEYNVVHVGVTQMWSIEEKFWYEINTYRIDKGWTTSYLKDGTGIQHNRPALFRIFPELRKSGSLRDHGYLCPKELWQTNKAIIPHKIFAHYGYATPSLIEKKCVRHGSIPAVTNEEIDGKNYEPDWKPADFNKDIAIRIFKETWLDKNVDLKKLNRRIFHVQSTNFRMENK